MKIEERAKVIIDFVKAKNIEQALLTAIWTSRGYYSWQCEILEDEIKKQLVGVLE